MDRSEPLIRLAEAKKSPTPKPKATDKKEETGGTGEPEQPEQPGEPEQPEQPGEPGTGSEGETAKAGKKDAGDKKTEEKKKVEAEKKQETKAGTEQPPLPPPAARFSTGEMALMMIAGALLATAAYLIIFAARMKSSPREDEDTERIAQDIAKALRKPGLPLDKVAGEIQKIEKDTANLVAAFQSLTEANEREKRNNTPLGRRIQAAKVFLEDVVAAAAGLSGDAEFAKVDQTLGLQAGFAAAAKTLTEVPSGGNQDTSLLAMLERGQFDTVLTLPAFIEAYFSNNRSWRRLLVTLRASEAAFQSLLEEIGVQIVMTPILSIVNAGDVRDTPTRDRRNVRTIAAVQQIAARMARDLGSREFLIVDCHAPGWISEKLGRRPPSFAVFDPTSWT